MSDEQYIDKLSMPQSTMADLARAMPEDFVRPSWEITTGIAQLASRIDLRPLIHDYCATSTQATIHDYATRASGRSSGLVPRRAKPCMAISLIARNDGPI